MRIVLYDAVVLVWQQPWSWGCVGWKQPGHQLVVVGDQIYIGLRCLFDAMP